MRRVREFLCLALVVICSSIPFEGLAESEFPYPIVCQEMERMGERLLERDTLGFYFVDALGKPFPVPNFIKVLSAEKSSSYEIEMRGWARPHQHLDSLDSQDIHAASNVCGWTITMSFGSRGALSEHAGSVQSIEERAESKFSIGDMTVLRLSYPGLESISTVLVFNENGYMSFTSDDADAALWMIRLFHDLHRME